VKPHGPDNLGDKRMTTAGPGRPRGSKNKLTRERLELEIHRLATSNIIDAFEGVHGNRKKFTLRELKAMPEDFQRCIASIKVRTENLTVGDDSQDITVEIKLWSKEKALELAGRTLGMFRDKIEISAPEELLSRLDRAKVRARAEKEP
jgi:phage terminase small subunit